MNTDERVARSHHILEVVRQRQWFGDLLPALLDLGGSEGTDSRLPGKFTAISQDQAYTTFLTAVGHLMEQESIKKIITLDNDLLGALIESLQQLHRRQQANRAGRA